VIRTLILTLAVCLALAACDKKPSAKFHPGDRVVVKLNRDKKGVVYVRHRFFVDDLYYLAVPGKPDSVEKPYFHSNGEYWATDDVSPHAKAAFWWGKAEPWHTEGPYYDTDLLLASN